eukprot:TRINITY_DN2253_c0_g3_i3.p1 TRINITY_DN2253_c0_g3~~TRINITY_DN2253_c0_g3_i3.p1  ORF type:complete len:203 (+),score=46.58 TRINITY_DN2253_c0_g3_i3:323-931(+)
MDYPSISYACWGGYNDHYKQFAYVDETGICLRKIGSLVLRDLKKKTQIYEKAVSNAVLMSCALEQSATKLLACGGLDTKIYLFNINRKEEPGRMSKTMEIVGHAGIVTCCNFLNENFIVSGSNDSVLILWDIEKEGASVRQFVDHESEITCMDVCEEDRNIIVSGSDDTTIRVWDVRVKEPCTRVFEESKSSINSVKFMPGR